MQLIDWIFVIAYLLISLAIGLKYRESAGKSLSEFFLGGRKISWFVAGISLAATTFAADTPLWVTERIAQNGISGNWLWWNMMIGGMLTTFFFAQYWRRAGVLTELEFIELRYGGRPAALLRGFKALYMGFFLNSIIIGWVNAAMIMIIMVFFDMDRESALMAVAGLMVLVAIYSSLSGLTGVVITDVFQFAVAMISCVVLAIFVLSTREIGGIQGLKSSLPEWRFNFFPALESGNELSDGAGIFSVTIGAFLTYGLVQWWASWYPGAEPGGGGYVAQRIMGTKNEKHALYASLFFQVAHYCLRPWPWIIVGLCSLVLYPDLEVSRAGMGFVYVMRDYLPPGLKGLLFVAFLAAYMSTISTQLNWAASYLTNDFYRRFIHRPGPDEAKNEKKLVKAGRLFTILIMMVAMIATAMIETIDHAAKFLIECGAGLGLVLILRWYYWRINAWSEITAIAAPFAGYSVSHFILHLDFPSGFIFTTTFTTLSWILVTRFTKAEDVKVLTAFHDRIRPGGSWSVVTGVKFNSEGLGYRIICWIASLVMTYSILFATGYIIFSEWKPALLNSAIAILAFLFLRQAIGKINYFESGKL